MWIGADNMTNYIGTNTIYDPAKSYFGYGSWNGVSGGNSFTKIVTLEGKFQTGEIVRVQCAAVRGSEVLQTLLPDLRASFHDWNHNVEVDYERTLIFVLPPQWLYAGRLKIRRVAGFSGAPAIEKTSGGDVVAGHFIGHDTVDIDGRKMTLGVVEDYRAIRAAVESFAALPRMELSRTKD